VLATIAGTAADWWERRSIGPGGHGERVYDWTAVALDTAGLPDGGAPHSSSSTREYAPPVAWPSVLVLYVEPRAEILRP
jgi:hypothetical protein